MRTGCLGRLALALLGVGLIIAAFWLPWPQ
jgi:hypothetical protein